MRRARRTRRPSPLIPGDLETGAGHARRAVAASPRHGEAHGLLAELHRRAGENEAAARERERERQLPDLTPLPDPVYAALAAEGVSSYWFRRRGRAYLDAGDYEDAVRELERAVEAVPRPEIHDDLGLALQGLGRYAEAAERHRAALELRPDHPASLVRLGTALDGAGRLDEAIAAAARALELRPGLLPASLNLGTWLARAGRRAEAAAAFRRGLEHAPDDPRLAARLAWILATAPEDAVRDGAEAVRLAEGVRERLGERVPEALDVLAAAYAEAGRFDEAVATARRARELADGQLARAIGGRIALYTSGEAYREKSSPQPPPFLTEGEPDPDSGSPL
jgi:tetratricopeptide (TPR) repeat protein